MNNDDPYNVKSKSTDELLRMKTGHNSDTLEYQYADTELEKRKSASKQNITTSESKHTTNNVHNGTIESGSKPINWNEKILIKIAIGIITFLICACVIWVINHYLNLNLK